MFRSPPHLTPSLRSVRLFPAIRQPPSRRPPFIRYRSPKHEIARRRSLPGELTNAIKRHARHRQPICPTRRHRSRRFCSEAELRVLRGMVKLVVHASLTSFYYRLIIQLVIV